MFSKIVFENCFRKICSGNFISKTFQNGYYGKKKFLREIYFGF